MKLIYKPFFNALMENICGGNAELQVSNVPTIVLWIARFVFVHHESGDVDASSLSKTPRKRGVKGVPRAKHRENSALVRREEVGWPSIQISSCRILQKIAKSDKYLALLLANGVDQKLMDLIITKSTNIDVHGAAAKALSYLLRDEVVRMVVTLSGNTESRSAALAALGFLIVDNQLACKESWSHSLPLDDRLKAKVNQLSWLWEEAFVIIEQTKFDHQGTCTPPHSTAWRIDVMPHIMALRCPKDQTNGLYHLIKCGFRIFSDNRDTQYFCTLFKGLGRVMYGAVFARPVLSPSRHRDQKHPRRKSHPEIRNDWVLRQVPLPSLLCFPPKVDFSDITGNIFYDVGPLKASDRLKSLQFYAKDPVNDARPVWILNITEIGTEEATGFSLPYDPELRKAVQICVAKIGASTDANEKAETLAM
ncbi:hypothetical protein EGR_06171 [Echinococcus granulosus]|uniref:Uncharacterized protein n=1 Tax=Echinococcus granulosus TaxID=6210 RepID=W6ULH8_ECHGR|nr:hypothetical protein EGR_06171 [Echinococcus granulosus]EUB58952.1 hypothetical protein EGR_06171 [Echinococcus granulosus]